MLLKAVAAGTAQELDGFLFAGEDEGKGLKRKRRRKRNVSVGEQVPVFVNLSY